MRKLTKLLTALVTLGFISANTMSVLLACYFYKKKHQKGEIKKFFRETSSLLLVTAHPDDESLFFVPSFESLNIPGIRTYHLSLSNGNSDGKGKVREMELASACKVLKIEHHQVIHDPYLQDGKKNKWDTELIADHVVEYAKKNNIENILTFDSVGVSGHPNHIAVHHGVRLALQSLPNVNGWELISCGTLRKYVGMMDFLLYYIIGRHDNENRFTFFTPDIFRAYEAVIKHHTQISTPQKFFNLFSRDSFVNEIRRLKPIKFIQEKTLEKSVGEEDSNLASPLK